MIPFNLYGMMILFPCAGVVFVASSRLDELIDATGMTEGFWIGIFFLVILTLSSLCASLFDRTDVAGFFSSYRSLWRQFYYGDRTHPKARVAGFLTPLSVSPCLMVMFAIMFWVLQAFLTPPREPTSTFLSLIGLSLAACGLCLGFAKLTQKIRLIKDTEIAEQSSRPVPK